MSILNQSDPDDQPLFSQSPEEIKRECDAKDDARSAKTSCYPFPTMGEYAFERAMDPNFDVDAHERKLYGDKFTKENKAFSKQAKSFFDFATVPMPQSKPGRKATFKRGFEVADAPVDWLWEGFIPRGMFTMLAGEGGTGKSTLTCALTAVITTGGTWPDGTKCAKPGNVLIWSSEDPEEYVIKPRMVAAGANPYAYATIEATVDAAGNKKAFNPAEDLPTLYESCVEIGGVDLIVIDPILAVVADDANAANKVRAALQPTIELAKKLNCAIIGISHFAKNSEKRAPVDRVLNSQAFTALARMNLSAAKNESDDSCVFTRIKTNIAKSGDGFAYTLKQVSYANPTGQTIKTQRLVWGEALTGSPREILASVAYDEKQAAKLTPQAIETAKSYIRSMLWNGQKVLAVEMVGGAQERYISDYALKAAIKEMNVKTGPLEYQGRHHWWIP